MVIKDVFAPVSEELGVFKGKFKEQLSSRIKIVDTIARYVVKSRGKNLRPLLVMLSAKACGGEVTEHSYRASITIELIHTATLVHDDVVDGADMRRGLPSINAIWKNKMSVLMGDYLLANALISIVSIHNFDAMMLLSEATKRTSQGELLQMHKSRKMDIDEETYFRIIKDKTGALIAAACELGALTTGQKKKVRDALKDYGENIGVAFQIKDDLFDFEGKQNIIGKTKGRDLLEQKLTLPLIYALTQGSKSESRKILSMIRKSVKPRDVKYIHSFTEQNGGMAYAKSHLAAYSQRAVEALRVLPPSSSQQGLINFVEFNQQRNK